LFEKAKEIEQLSIFGSRVRPRLRDLECRVFVTQRVSANSVSSACVLLRYLLIFNFNREKISYGSSDSRWIVAAKCAYMRTARINRNLFRAHLSKRLPSMSAAGLLFRRLQIAQEGTNV